MKLHRFILSLNLKKDLIISKDNELINQIKNVLRLKTGHFVILADGFKNEAKASIKSFSKNEIEFKIEERFENKDEPTKNIKLYCAILKKENFELVIQKATEIGVKAIIPIRSAHTVKQNIKLDRLNKIAKEASEQSGRSVIPDIYEPLSFAEALEDSKTNEANFIFDTDAKEKFYSDKNNIGIFIGPEGGWTEKEIGEAQKQNIKIVSLGKLTLRAETAAIVSSFIALN